MAKGKTPPAPADVDVLEFDPFPRYSARGKLSRDVFVDAYNDVMVYFEDVGYEEFYKRLLSVVAPSLAISDVFCVGGKTELFKELRRTEKIVGKPQLFIADLDFDDLFVGLGTERNLVYLRKYSIENYWIEPSIFFDLIVAEIKGQRKRDVDERLKLRTFLDEINEAYDRVARLFVLCQKHRLGIESTKVKISELIDSGSHRISEKWVSAYEAKVRRAAQKKQLGFAFDDNDFSRELDNSLTPLPSHAKYAEVAPDSHYCGKHLLGLIVNLLNVSYGLKYDIHDHFVLMSRTLHAVPTSRFNTTRNDIEVALRSIATPPAI